MVRQDPKYWIFIVLGLGIIASFFFSSGFQNTISRRRSIRQLKAEIISVTEQIRAVQIQIKELKTNPRAYELLIRQELGYLKPGEREIRFTEIHQ